MSLEIRLLSVEWEYALAKFFSSLDSSAEPYFHPHPFTDEAAKRLAHYRGKDLYYLLVEGSVVIAYGMLRGWDEGYEVPSLGIAVDPNQRGRGFGELLIHFLHSAARCRGAKEVRLRVHHENTKAYRLYARLGYRFDGEEDRGQLVGRLTLQ